MAQRTPLFILTYLETDRGRTLSDAVQCQLLESYEQHRWYPCVLDLAKCNASELRIEAPHTIVLDCDVTDLETECARLEIKVDDVAVHITNSPCSKWTKIPTLAPHPALLGAVLADRLLRRCDDEYWLIAAETGPAHEILRDAFVQELVHAGRPPEQLRAHLKSTNQISPDKINRPANVALLDRSCFNSLEGIFPLAELADFPNFAPSPRPQLTRHAESAARQLLKILSKNPRSSRWLPLAICQTPPQTYSSDPIINQASDLIDSRLAETQLGPAILAELLDIPRRTLERRFRKVMQNSLLQEIQRRKILAAKLYLTGVERSSARAAAACGFKDSRMLNLAFQRFTGRSPREFLKDFDRVITR